MIAWSIRKRVACHVTHVKSIIAVKKGRLLRALLVERCSFVHYLLRSVSRA